MKLPFLRTKSLQDILFDDDFWAEQRTTIMKVAAPIFREAFLEGAELALEATPRREKVASIPGDFDAVNTAADSILSNYENQWWARINQTQRDALRAAIQRSIENGTGVRGVIREIEPLFGRERARMWAITETTNLIGEGARATYMAAGFLKWEWRTVGDSRVDPLCEGLAGEQFPITTPFQARHPLCRCWADPVLVR